MYKLSLYHLQTCQVRDAACARTERTVQLGRAGGCAKGLKGGSGRTKLVPEARPGWSGEGGFARPAAARLGLRRGWSGKFNSRATPHPVFAPRSGATLRADRPSGGDREVCSSIFLGHMNPSWDGEGTPVVSSLTIRKPAMCAQGRSTCRVRSNPH